VLRVTLDTNAVNGYCLARIEVACAGHDVELMPTAVTDWEQEGTAYAKAGRPVLVPTTPFGVGPFGEGPFGGVPPGRNTRPGRYDEILKIITTGGFPPPGARNGLTPGNRKKELDAVIFETHVGEGRDVFVTRDVKDFIKDGKREALEALGSTRIMTVDEFCAWAESGFK
jgi:hypothetical protein